MAEVRTDVKVRYWPSPQDYNEAVQNLGSNARDPELRGSIIETTELGLPRPLTGAFASVYRVRSGGKDMAVRCFLRDMAEQKQRYHLISDFVQHDDLPYTVGFDFVAEGIRIGGNWYPVLKMDWVDGLNLDMYVAKHLGTPKIEALANNFKRMCIDLDNAGIAHGDLQHGNIIICNDEIRLVDYDGMFVPKMNGMVSNEVGHRNYQHPDRTGQYFAGSLDHFSSWVIYTSLRCLAIDPNLHAKLGVGDDCLLFRADDFRQPEFSYAFAMLESHPNGEIVRLARHLRFLCHQAAETIPAINAEIPETIELPPLSAVAPTPVAGQLPRDGLLGLPDWINLTEQEQSNLPEWMRNQIVTRRVWESSASFPPYAQSPQAAQPGTQVAPPAVHRIVEFDDQDPRSLGGSRTRLSPEVLQFLMLFNPIVWGIFLVSANHVWASLSVLCFIVAAVMEHRIWNESGRHKRLAKFGCMTKTTFLSVRSSVRNVATGTQDYFLRYNFHDNTGRLVTVDKSIPKGLATRLGNLRDEVVYYDPLIPENAILKSEGMYKVVDEWQIPPGVELAALSAARSNQVPTRAVVRNIDDAPDSRMVYYQYPTHKGVINGHKEFMLTAHTYRLMPGDEFTVLYQEQNPEDHVWWPDTVLGP